MKAFSLLGAVWVMLLLSSCTGLTQKEIDSIKPPPKPYERTTDYSMALDKFSAMLRAYDVPEIQFVLLGKTVVNKTACANLPMDITQLVATAVNRLGGRIRYAPYYPTYTELEARLGFPVNRATPLLVIDGAITECDENVVTVGGGINADATGTYNGNEGTAQGSGNKTSSISHLAIDLHLMDYRSSLLLPRIQSSLAVDVKTLQDGYQFAIQVLGSGFGLNRSRKFTQGKNESIRTLVDMSILQVLGQYFQLPYWRCLNNATPDNEVIWMLEDTFSRVPVENGIAAIQSLLQQYGYAVQATGTVDESTRVAIADISAKSSGRAPAMISPSLYSYLFINLPLDLSRPWRTVEELPQQVVPEQQTGQIEGTPEQASPPPEPPPQAPPVHHEEKYVRPLLGLQTAVIYRPGKLGETVLISGGKLKSGDQYKVVVEPEQDCYLYVFQLDSGGRLFSLFPRSDRTDGLTNPVQGKISYDFPGQGQYFYLDQRKGQEYIYFYSASKPDQIIEKTIQQLNQQLPDSHKKQIEGKLLQYLTSKETVTASGTGKSLALEGVSGMQSIRMNRVTKLGKNKLYVFSFRHQ